MSVRHVTARAAFGLGLMLPGGLVSGQTEQEKEPRPTELERTLSGIERIELMKRGLDSDESLQSGGSQDFVPTVSGEAQVLPGKLIDLGPDEATDTEKTAEWRAQNWLVHGVNSLREGDDETDEERAEAEWGADDPEQGSVDFWLELAMGEQKDEDSDNPETSSDRLKAADKLSTVNPLDGFMAQWLSADELARLNIAHDQTPGDSLKSMGSDLAPGRIDRLLPRSDSLSQTVDIPEGKGPNPYLDLNRDVSPVGGLSGILAPPVTTTRNDNAVSRSLPNTVRSVPVPAGTSAAAQKNNEPWRPPVKDDEKYFRRLNRF
jgi:hypothetical protein